MKNKVLIFVATCVMVIGVGFGISQTNASGTSTMKSPSTQTLQPKTTVNNTEISVKPLDLVNNPSKFLQKRVKIVATFDKFSTLGLDYKPAFKDSKDYITFLVKREDVANTIPISEIKNFMKRKEAEKFIDLESGDKIEYTGIVFSNALGDVWIDVEKFVVISSKKTINKV